MKISGFHSVSWLALSSTFFHLGLAKVDKWTPADFPWDQQRVGPPESWNALFHNLSDPATEVSPEVMTLGRALNAEDGTQLLALPFSITTAWQFGSIAMAGAGLSGAIHGCVQNDGSPESHAWCAVGLFATIGGVAGSYSAAKRIAKSSQGWFNRGRNHWDQNTFLEDIDLTVFGRHINSRDLDKSETTAQRFHDVLTYHAVRGLSEHEPEFLGYAEDHHHLASRDFGSHPLAPMFRLRHSKYGDMHLVSRDSDEGIHYTVSYADHPTHLTGFDKRNEVFRHERFSSHVVEGRFDSEASLADPGNIQLDAANAFNTIESTLECFLAPDANYKDDHVLSMQYLDNANRATFGFGSIGIFPQADLNGKLRDFTPRGLPLTGGQNC